MSETDPATSPTPLPPSSNNTDEEIGSVSPPTATAELVAPEDQQPVEVTAVPHHPLEPAEATAVLANVDDTGIVIASTMMNAEPVATATFDLEASAEATAEVETVPPRLPPAPQPQARRTITTRAEFNSVTFFKNEQSQLGLTVCKNSPSAAGGLFQVTALDPTGILAQSPLRVGDILLSINGKSCSDLESSQQVMDWLQLLSGTVTLVGHNCGGDPQLVETMIEKPTPDARVGLTLRRSSSNGGCLVVSRIPADGLFVHSLLNVGDRVLSINSVECTHMDGQVALDMIRACPQYVSVVTETLATTGVVVAISSSSSTTAAADALQLLTTHRHSYEYREQTCFCIWMLIVSLLLVGIGVYTSK